MCESLFLFVEVGSSGVDDTFGVADGEVFSVCTGGDIVFCACDTGSTGTVHDKFTIFDLFADDFQSIEDTGKGDDGSTVLVIVEDRNLHSFFQSGFDLEAGGSTDIFQVDTAECGFQCADSGNDFFRICLAVFCEDITETQGNSINACKFLEQNSFTFHHRHTGFRADVTETENGGTVGNNGNGVGAAGVFPYGFRMVMNFHAGDADTGGVSEGKVILRIAGFGRDNIEFSRDG